MQQRLLGIAQRTLEQDKQRFIRTTTALDALSPLKVLSRGYAMAQTADGTVLRSSEQVESGERIRVQLGQGSLSCTVDGKE